MSDRWYACRVVYESELDDGEGYWSREDERFDVVSASNAEEAMEIAKKRMKPAGWGWYVFSASAEECESEEEARRKVQSWKKWW